jgi:hypothetical protein
MIDNVIEMEEMLSEIKLGNLGGHLDILGIHQLTNQNNQFMLDIAAEVCSRCSSLTELLGQCDCVIDSRCPECRSSKLSCPSAVTSNYLLQGALNCRKAIVTKLNQLKMLHNVECVPPQFNDAVGPTRCTFCSQFIKN